jgi:hypothetical protein
VGGDTTSAVFGLTINITVIGAVDKDKITYRSGAQENDLLVVTGDLGGAYVGLQALNREKEVFLANSEMQPQLEGLEYLVERQLKPEARKDVIGFLDELGVIPTIFRKMGIEMEFRGDDIYLPAQESYKIQSLIDGSILTIKDGIWPAFTPDLISIALVTATQAKGSVLIHQWMFESRLFFVDNLIDMGAKIILCDPHRAVVIGSNRETKMRGITMSSPDIRAGVAMLIAALAANGTSTINNIEQIDRGYQFIDKRLNAIGAEIQRID